MKSTVIYSLFLSLFTLFVSCNNEETAVSEGNDSSELVIKTSFNELRSSLKAASVSDFAEGSKLGLFITKGNLEDDYTTGIAHNIESTLTGGIWKQNPPVYLYSHNAGIYAYYPYNAGHTNGAEIPIQSGVTDHMYGTHTRGQGTTVNKETPVVNLTMNHACTLVQFNIYKANYSSEGRLTRVAINNAPGKSVVFYSGKLNVKSGLISDKSGADKSIQTTSSPLLLIPDKKFTDEKDYVKLLVIPTSKTSSPGEVIVTFNIDGKDYTWEVPAATEWRQGTKNTYDVLLNGTQVRIGDVKITPWTDGVSGNVTLE